MFERFDAASRHVLVQVNRIAQEVGASEIDVHHLLAYFSEAPFFRDDLLSSGLTWERLGLPPREAGKRSAVTPLFSPELKKVLELALRIVFVRMGKESMPSEKREGDPKPPMDPSNLKSWISPAVLLRAACDPQVWPDPPGVDRDAVLQVALRHGRLFQEEGAAVRRQISWSLCGTLVRSQLAVLISLCALGALIAYWFVAHTTYPARSPRVPSPVQFCLYYDVCLVPLLPIPLWGLGLLSPAEAFEKIRGWRRWRGWTARWRRLAVRFFLAEALFALITPAGWVGVGLVVMSAMAGLWSRWRVSGMDWGLEGPPRQWRALPRRDRRALDQVAFALNVGTFLNGEQALSFVEEAIERARWIGARQLEVDLTRIGIILPLTRGWLSTADSRSVAAMDRHPSEPEVRLARAAVLRRVGRAEEAFEEIRGSMTWEECFAWDVATYLEVASEAEVSLADCEKVLTETSSIMLGQPDPSLVMRSYLALARRAFRDGAFSYVQQVIEDAFSVGKIEQLLPLPLRDGWNVRHLRAEAYALLGYALACRRDWEVAFGAFIEAHEAASGSFTIDRVLGTTSMVNAVACASQVEAPELASLLHGLDLVRACLEVLENERRSLTDSRSRAGTLDFLRLTYEAAFRIVSLVQAKGRGEGGELAVWMLESMRRDASSRALKTGMADYSPQLSELLAELALLEHAREGGVYDDGRPISSEGYVDSLGSLRERIADVVRKDFARAVIPEELSLEQIRLAAKGRNVLMYGVEGEEHFLTVRGVWWPANGEPHYFSGVTSDLSEEALDELRRLSPRSSEWEHLSALLIPDLMRAWLASAPGPVELIVIPAGPLSRVPFVALPIGDQMLGDLAMLSLAFSLSALREDGLLQVCPGAVVHLASNVSTILERRAWERNSGALGPITYVEGTAQMKGALRTQECGIAYVSSHGRGSGGMGQLVEFEDGVLSAATALSVQWPSVVILGACWVSSAELRAGIEAIGLPMSCLLSGASLFVGGAFPVTDDTTSAVLAGFLDNLAAGMGASAALRSAQLGVRAELGVDAPAQEWAGLVAWRG